MFMLSFCRTSRSFPRLEMAQIVAKFIRAPLSGLQDVRTREGISPDLCQYPAPDPAATANRAFCAAHPDKRRKPSETQEHSSSFEPLWHSILLELSFKMTYRIVLLVLWLASFKTVNHPGYIFTSLMNHCNGHFILLEHITLAFILQNTRVQNADPFTGIP